MIDFKYVGFRRAKNEIGGVTILSITAGIRLYSEVKLAPEFEGDEKAIKATEHAARRALYEKIYGDLRNDMIVLYSRALPQMVNLNDYQFIRERFEAILEKLKPPTDNE